jgi:outer membrane protein insertion porin family
LKHQRLIFTVFGVLFFWASTVFAASDVVKSIVIKGQKRIEESAVRAKIKTKIGDTLTPAGVKDDIGSLFGSGFFNNITVSREPEGGGVSLVFVVEEKPVISEIVYEGNEELDDTEMADSSALKAYQILDMGKVQEAVDKMTKLYEDKGFFLAKIKTRVTPGADNTAQLKFVIVENEKVRVAKVRFLGNRKIPSDKLKSVMMIQEGSFFSFMSGSGGFKQDAFDEDIQRLYYLVYFNEGYIQAKIDRPQTYVTPDKRSIYITIKVDEGEQFNVGEISFSGDLLFSDQELFETVKLKTGELFVHSVLRNDLTNVQAKYGDLGYAYANVIPRTRPREKERVVDVTFEIDKGNKVYLNRINMTNNTKTRDKVIRREMEIREGELYNETRKRESLANIRRLGFFEEVTFNTKTPPGRPDLMDIDVVVKERNTGSIQLGAGYSNYSKFLLNGEVNQTNLLGRGQRLGVSMNLSEREKLFNASFTEPYFWDTEWSVGGNIFYKESKRFDFTEDRQGVGLTVGHPLAKYLSGSLGYKIDDTKLTLTDNADVDLYPVDTANGITSSVTAALAYDSRDDRFSPSEGTYNVTNLEYAGVGGDIEYTKGTASLRYYKKVFMEVVWRNNLSYGFISPNQTGKDVPFNQLFLLGGPYSLRGFDSFSVGKRKFSNRRFQELISDPDARELAMRPFGGTQQLFYNLEFQFPLINEAGVKGVVFYDVGYADDDLSLSEFRSNWGFGIRWFSPIGPLRFEFGIPFNRQEVYGERAVNFQFAIGPSF